MTKEEFYKRDADLKAKARRADLIDRLERATGLHVAEIAEVLAPLLQPKPESKPEPLF